MSTEEQADERCMGNMTGSEIVGACREAAVTALQEAMDNTINNRFYRCLTMNLRT